MFSINTMIVKRYLLPGAIIVIVISGLWLFHEDSLPEGLIQVNGRLEGDRITVSTEYSGQIQTLDASEGDRVKAGQIMAHLDNDRLQKQFSQAEAGVAKAATGLNKAKARKEKALRDAERARELRPSGAISEDDLEKAELLLDTAARDVAIARASLSQAQSAVEEIRCMLDKYVIRAPASGTVTAKLVSLGETLAPGAPLFDMVDLDQLYVKAYLPEPDIGKVRRGLKAHVFTDAFPDRPFSAEVAYIASRSQFTPKEVQTRDERVKQVFAVKLYLAENPDHSLSPGMPTDAVIRWKEEVSWRSPVR